MAESIDKKVRFMENGLPEGAVPLNPFHGYFVFDNPLTGKREIYEPKGDGTYNLRNEIDSEKRIKDRF